ncbi:MAG TPA: substrate-binding domain-containing protein, partial [Bacillota bacterium]|nr:substrate-binding domain-containing protein [Bacillota bacterium]
MGSHEKLIKRNTVGFFVLLLIVVSLLSTGCLGKVLKKPAAKKEPPPPKIGILMATMQGDGYQIIKKEMEKAKKKEKVDLKWQDAKNDPQTQQEQVEKLTKAKVKVIVLDMVNPSLGGGLVPKIAQEKIPVLALD